MDIVHQVPLPMDLSRQEYWRGCHPTPGDRPSLRIEPRSPALTGRFFLTEPPRKPRRECDSAMKTKGTMSSAGTGMDLEVIILGEVSHRKTSV